MSESLSRQWTCIIRVWEGDQGWWWRIEAPEGRQWTGEAESQEAALRAAADRLKAVDPA